MDLFFSDKIFAIAALLMMFKNLLGRVLEEASVCDDSVILKTFLLDWGSFDNDVKL
jgi:hypothetical protein